MLFASARRRSHRRGRPRRRFVLVMDQVEAKPPGNSACLELLSRMVGKDAPVQWVFVGRSKPWQCPDGPAAAWVRETNPTRLKRIAGQFGS